MVKAYFGLQYQMLHRKFRDAQFNPWLAYLIIAIAFVGFSLLLFSKTTFAPYIYILTAFAFIGNLSASHRTEFLEICYGKWQMQKIRMLENLICSIPFFTFLLYQQYYLAGGILLLLTVILALINFRTTLSFTIWTPFSKRPYEFSTGFRNTFYLFFAAYTLCLIAVTTQNFNLGAFAMFLVFATTWTYYLKPENEYYVWNFSQKPKAFLWGKFRTAMLYSASLAMPLAIVLSIYFPENIYLLLLFFALGWAFLMFMMVNKYSAYPKEINLFQGILIVVSFWFPPMLVVLIPFLFSRSQNRLSSLLK